MKITVTTNHWRVPSVERCFDGFIEGRPSEDQRRKRIEDTVKARSAWKPNSEALSLLEEIKYYIGRRIHIQLWDPIMSMLEEEGPFPIEADCVDVITLGHFSKPATDYDVSRESGRACKMSV